ncbi:MAG: hypothetical protein KF830_12775 [Planctomycetes bacterium]|nr:hypothetical protein [Planctomycetota bacterium]
MNFPLPRTQILTVAALAAAAAAVPAQSILSQYGEIVHAVGDPVPPAILGVTPAPAGATIFATGNFDAPSIDQNGSVLYRARMSGSGLAVTDDRAYFLGRANGDLRMVLRNGDPAPGLPGLTMRTAGGVGISNPVRISPYGELLFFQSTLYDTGISAVPPATQDTALFWGPADALLCLAREGDPVPFLGTGETYGPFGVSGSALQYSAINQGGAVLFFGQLLGGASTTADDGYLCSGTPGSLQLVLREGDVFPDGSVVAPASGATQLSFTNQMNALGQVLHAINFSTTLGTATTANDRALAIWTPGGGQSTLIVREGDQVPGLPAGVIFGPGWTVAQGNASFTNNGNTVIQSLISGPGITSANDRAIHYGGLGGMTLVMQRGDLCPGLANGEMFGLSGDSSLTCNDLGQVAFVNTLTGPLVGTSNDSSLWLGSAGNLTLLAREGDPVPGYPGFTYGQINTGTNSPLLNGRGYVLFQADITDGVNPARRTLFGYTPAHGVRAMLDSTDTLTTTLGTDVWTGLSSNAGFNSGDGGQTMFNNEGDFAYRPSIAGAGVACILRGHLGSFVAEPSSVPATGGVPQNFHVDFGPGQPFRLYAILASSLGSRPGFVSPLGPQTIPLNYDPLWTQLSLDAANSGLWINTIGITDANGKGIGASGFVFPAGFPGFQGVTVQHAAVALDFSLAITAVSEPSALKLY